MPADPIRVMISSRCLDRVRGEAGGEVALQDVRLAIKQRLESERLLGRETFHCWIHEDEPALGADANSWEKCLREVRRQHIVIVLYNGNAGYGHSEQEIGLCHAEMMEALNTAPGKVRIIDIAGATTHYAAVDQRRNDRFAEYMKLQDRAVRFAVHDGQVMDRVVEAVHDAVLDLTAQGAQFLHAGRYATGTPLDWSRLDYARRKAAMEKVMREAMSGNVLVDGRPVHFVCHAVPAAMSVAAAREIVGKPFLRDHETLAAMAAGTHGPVHLIGCHKGVTENQAVALLGFPDATIVTPEFGVYVADNIQKIQLVLLANCRDESTTRMAVQRFTAWLNSSGEARYLADRAVGRRSIVEAIAAQQAPGPAPQPTRAQPTREPGPKSRRAGG